MKYYSIGLVAFLSVSVLAANKKTTQDEVKCHIELYGGQEAIYFGLAAPDELKHYAQSLLGKKITAPRIKGKKPIYKVFECVAMNDKFSSRQARILDSETPK